MPKVVTPPEKQDLRVLRTHKLLRDALIALLKTRDFEKITVHDIVETAMVNRATFYKYYSGKSDLAGAMISEFKQAHADLLSSRFTDSAEIFGEKEMELLTRSRDVLLALWKINTRRHNLYDDMFLMIKKAFIKLAARKLGENSLHQHRDYQAEMFAHLALASLKYQLEHDREPTLGRSLPLLEEMLAVVKR